MDAERGAERGFAMRIRFDGRWCLFATNFLELETRLK